MTEPMFIREYTIDGSVCDQIIEYYEKEKTKKEGKLELEIMRETHMSQQKIQQ